MNTLLRFLSSTTASAATVIGAYGYVGLAANGGNNLDYAAGLFLFHLGIAVAIFAAGTAIIAATGRFIPSHLAHAPRDIVVITAILGAAIYWYYDEPTNGWLVIGLLVLTMIISRIETRVPSKQVHVVNDVVMERPYATRIHRKHHRTA